MTIKLKNTKPWATLPLTGSCKGFYVDSPLTPTADKLGAPLF